MNSKNAESSDLRPPPIYNKAHASLSPYGPHSEPTNCQSCSSVLAKFQAPKKTIIKKSEELKTGSQAKFHAAAYKSFESGWELNTLVTIRLTSFCKIEGSQYFNLHSYDFVRLIVRRLGKWLTRDNRGLPVAYIWAREIVKLQGEHLHLALHLPEAHRKSFLGFLERLFDEPIASRRRPVSRRTRGEIACSRNELWHVAVEEADGKPQFTGYWLASYLGKAEPSERKFRGKLINNTRKPERGKSFGGRLKHTRYDVAQGLIEGNYARIGRYGISRSISG